MSNSTKKNMKKTNESKSKIVNKKFQISLIIHCEVENESYNASLKYHVRLISSWLDCCQTIDVLGPIDQHGNIGKYLEYDISFNAEKLKQFHTNPGIYAVLIKDDGLLRPITFAYLDCSSLLLQVKEIDTRSNQVEGMNLELRAAINETLVEMNEIINLEPCSIIIHQIVRFPREISMSIEDDLNNVYLVSRLDLGEGMTRVIFGRPKVSSISYDSDDSDDNEDIEDKQQNIIFDLHICILPGLSNLEGFKESLKSSTFLLQIHKNDICSESFSSASLQEFNKLSGTTVSSKKNDKTTTSSKTKSSSIETKVSNSPILFSKGSGSAPTSADLFIITSIYNSLLSCEFIHSFGGARYRLDSLLSKSSELLIKFKQLQINSQEVIPGNVNDSISTTYEDIKAIVRPEKPIKPKLWERDAEISLREMLVEHKTNPSKPTPKRREQFEKFLDFGTMILMRCELHRQFLDSKSSTNTTISPLINLVNRNNNLMIEKFKSLLDNMSPIFSLQDKVELLQDLSICPFARMCVIMRYDDEVTLERLHSAIDCINSKALPTIQGNIRSYHFDEKELESCRNGTLDIVTGVMFIDNDYRIVIVEGLACPNMGMEFLYSSIPRTPSIESNEVLKVLCNPNTLFPNRLYPNFGPDLKRIRLSQNLRKLIISKDLYNHQQIPIECFHAFDMIVNILDNANSIYTTKVFDLYPSMQSIQQLELLFGDSLSRQDISGNFQVENVHESRILKSRDSKGSKESQETSKFSQSNRRAKPILDYNVMYHNDEYSIYLSSRPTHRVDYLEQQRNILREVYQRQLFKKQSIPGIDTKAKANGNGIGNGIGNTNTNDNGNANTNDNDGKEKVYLYSTQTKNTKERLLKNMKSKLLETKDGIFTFSKNFTSQTVSLDNIKDSKIDELINYTLLREEDTNKWMTRKGFQYPKPKALKELLIHPKKPTNSRIEELAAPWIDPRDKSRDEVSIENTIDPPMRLQFKSYDTFGILQPPKFENTELQLSLIGNRDGKLPRGKLLPISKEQDPSFFSSIHIMSKERLQQIEEDSKRQDDLWKSKVVVKDTNFHVDGFNKSKESSDCVSSQLERYTDILHDAPQTNALKTIRKLKTIRFKKDIGYSTTPITIMSVDEFADKKDVNAALVRTSNKSKFITADMSTGKVVDFQRFIPNDSLAPTLVKLLHTKSHPPMNAHEKLGPKWNGIVSDKI